jgi:aspartate-semialdehyde dehydrogenase
MRKYNVAIVGATGAVGKEFIALLAERRFPLKSLRLLASSRSAGTTVDTSFGPLCVEEATPDSFRDIDVAFFSAGGSVSKALAPAAVQSGAVVIDNTSAFRLDPDVPLVVPEVNAEAVSQHRGIIANPNCSTIIMVVAIKPIYDRAGINRIVASTYQAVSGAGAKAIAALEEESRRYLAGDPVEPSTLPFASAPVHHQIAFNLVPQIDVFEEMDYTKEEWKMVRETRKIMCDSELAVTATTVRVPIFRCHSESLNIETATKLTSAEARLILSEAPGVRVVDDPARMLYPMPLDMTGKDEVFVGRIREDNSIEKGLNLWVVGDQIRKGAALNALQIAEYMIAHGLL